MVVLAWLACALAGCAVSEPGTSLPTDDPKHTAAPTVTTVPPVTTIPTESTDVPFDPAALAAQISETVKQEMKQAHKEQYYSDKISVTVEDVYIREAFAIFDQSYVVFVDVAGYEYMAVETIVTVNGIEFCFGSPQPLLVYAQGHYYTLQEAFDAQIISAEDLLVIAENYCSAFPRP